MTLKYSFILPTYNEKDNILDVIAEIENNFENYEIVVIDDNSPDFTWKIVKEYSEKFNNKNIKVIVPEKRLGLTESIKLGINSVSGETAFWFDIDGTMRPAIFKPYLDLFDRGIDMVFFSRYVGDGKDARTEKLSVVLSIIISYLCRMVLSSKYKDYTSGFVGIKVDAAKKIEFGGDYGEYFIELLYKCIKSNYKIKEVPYTLNSRVKGETKTAPNFSVLFKRGLKYLYTVFNLRLKLVL